jgi:hypothetical protein
MQIGRPLRRTVLIAMSYSLVAACGSVPNDPGARVFPPGGVIRGTIVYQGPRPCSREGHVVGNAVVLAFDRRNLPPPDGFASAPKNFTNVTGDALFADEARYTGADLYCPAQAGFGETVTASAPFEIAPVAGASYEIRAFFDMTGDFLPEFTIRNLPERGDIGGGAIDTTDAVKAINFGNLDYRPRYLPVEVGLPVPPAGDASPSTIPDYAIPNSGFVAQNVTASLAAPFRTTRPYFYPQGERAMFDLAQPSELSFEVTQSSDEPAIGSIGIEGAAEVDPNSLPVLTIPQDIGILAPPIHPSPASAAFYESRFPRLRLQWGVPSAEFGRATSTPFQMQVAPVGQGIDGVGLFVWQNATLNPVSQMYEPQGIPEGGGVPELWPQVVLTKLSDPHANGPQPLVVLPTITLLAGSVSDSLAETRGAAMRGELYDVADPQRPRPVVFVQDHVTVALRPSVICVSSSVNGGVLVTPHPVAATADIDCSNSPCVESGTPAHPIVPADLLEKLSSVVSAAATGCLPIGRYAINVVYPNGQAWTVPNEAGLCSEAEGTTDFSRLTCTLKPRPVLYSQGPRAFVEVVAARDPAYCKQIGVPEACVGSP